MDKVHLTLAPIQGFTDMVYRRAWWACFDGLDEAFAPFVSTVAARKVRPVYFRELRPENNPGMTLTPQIMSKSAGDFIFLAGLLGEMGFRKVNWNLGCPSSTVVSRGRGAALMTRPGDVDFFLGQVIPAVAPAVSVKMRLGFDDPSQGLALLDIFENHGLAEIIVHPRLAIQGYSGRVDLDGFTRCLERSRHRIVYNGDIMDPGFFHTLVERFPEVSGWMLGRGVLADPFLPSCIKGAPVPGRIDALERIFGFHSLVFEGYSGILHGDSHLLARMKAFWHNLAPSFEDGGWVLKKIRKCRTRANYSAVVKEFFNSKPAWVPEQRRDTIWGK